MLSRFAPNDIVRLYLIAHGEQWRKKGKREWDKYTFGIYGCWVMGDDGTLDYIPEEKYTEELLVRKNVTLLANGYLSAVQYGETLPQILAKGRHVLRKDKSKWNEQQQQRAQVFLRIRKKKCKQRVSQRIVCSQNLYRDEKTIIYCRNPHIKCFIP